MYLSREYGPTAGIKPLREAVAKLYNERHRQDKESKYTWQNVAIVSGDRAGLIRIAAVLGSSYLSFFLPDYTAYNEMLSSLFRNQFSCPCPKTTGYHIHSDKIAEEIARGTSVILTRNQCNTTGRVVANPEQAVIQDLCQGRATFISDEFYCGYKYTSNCDGSTISAAENVENVNEDDALIIDGLTKRFRMPGWRIAWILETQGDVSRIGSCGSYLDNGAVHALQEAAVPMLKPTLIQNEMTHLQRHFQVCLEEKAIVVPGIFFGLNPLRRRDLFDSPCHHYVRLSYGSKMNVLKMGLDGIERLVIKHKPPNWKIE